MARDADTPRTRSEVFPSLTAELIFAANLAASVTDRTGVDPGWVRKQREQLPLRARQDLSRFDGFWWPTMGLVDFLCWNGLFHDPEDFLQDIAKIPIERFLSVLSNDDLTLDQVSELIADPSAARNLGDRISRFTFGDADHLEALFRDPEGHREALLNLVRSSDTALFRESFSLLVSQADSTIKTLERRLTTEDPVAVAASLREKRMHGPSTYGLVTFVPSRLIGHRHIQSWGNDHAIFFLQLGISGLVGPNETGTELAEFLKVLSDKTRMDILRLLCCGPSFGKEIASSLGLTTATVSRHLDQLKAAGLVREDRADANNVKRLRYVPESLDEQLERLKTYLLQP